MTKYYLLHICGDIDPELHGPFDNAGERDQKARSMRQQEPDDGLYRLDVDQRGVPTIYGYSHAFLEG